MAINDSDTIKWDYPLIRTTENQSVARPGLHHPEAHELVGFDGSTHGGLRPLWGYKRAYDLRYYDVVGDTNFGSSPNTLHDKDAEVTDFFPVDFKIGTDGYGYGFVYRSTRSNPSDGLADVFLDFWSSEEDGTAFGRTGKVVMSGVSPTAQMDVQVFGRLVYVFIAGRSPAMFFVKVTSEKKYIATASTWLNEDIVLETKADRVAVDPLLDRVMDLDNQTEARGHGLIRFDCSDEVGLTLVSAKMEFQVQEALFDDVTYKFARSVPAWDEDDASWTNFSAGNAWAALGGHTGADVVTTEEGSLTLLGDPDGLVPGNIGQKTVTFVVGNNGPVDFALAGTGEVNLMVYEDTDQVDDNLRRIASHQAINPLARPTLRLTFTTNFFELVHIGVAETDPLPGAGLQPTLESPRTGAVLGGLLPGDLDDPNRGGVAQLVLSTQTPQETGLFPDPSTGLCEPLTPPPGGKAAVGGGGGEGGGLGTKPLIIAQATQTLVFPDFLPLGFSGPEISFQNFPDEGSTEVMIIVVVQLLTSAPPVGDFGISTESIVFEPEPFDTYPRFQIGNIVSEDRKKIARIFIYHPHEPVTGESFLVIPHTTTVGLCVTVMMVRYTGGHQAATGATEQSDPAFASFCTLPVTVRSSLMIGVHHIQLNGNGLPDFNDYTFHQGLIDETQVFGELGSVALKQDQPDLLDSTESRVSWGEPAVPSRCCAIMLVPSEIPPEQCPSTAAGAMNTLGLRDGFYGTYGRPPTPLNGAFNVPTDNAAMQWTEIQIIATTAGDIGNPDNYGPLPTDGNWKLEMVASKQQEGVSVDLGTTLLTLTTVGFDCTSVEAAGVLDQNTKYTFVLKLTLTLDDCGEYIIEPKSSPAPHEGLFPLSFTTAGGPQPDARPFAPGDYTYAYMMFDSHTGRRTALSEVAQVRAFDFPGNEPDPDDPASEGPSHFFALEVVYDPDKFDQMLVYRSVNATDAGGPFAAAFLFLDRVVTLSEFETCEDVDGGAFDPTDPNNPDGLKQVIYYYRLEDKQLIYQESYTDRSLFDEEMPPGGAALMYDNTMLVGKIQGPKKSTPDETRITDDLRGIGELRWSSLTEISPELFSPFNRYVPEIPSNEIIRMLKVGSSAIGFSKDRLYHIRRHNIYIMVQEMHEGLGLLNHRAVDSAGHQLYYVTSKGLKAVDHTGRIDDINNLNELIINQWIRNDRAFLDARIQVAYDPFMGALFIHNPDYINFISTSQQWFEPRTSILWFNTAMITELFDTQFDLVRQGAWPMQFDLDDTVVPKTSSDYDNTLTERALWLMNNPAKSGSDDSEPLWRPRIYFMDHEKRKYMRGPGIPAETSRQIRMGDMEGKSRFTSVFISLALTHPKMSFIDVREERDAGEGAPLGGEGSWLYWTQTTDARLIGFKLLIARVSIPADLTGTAQAGGTATTIVLDAATDLQDDEIIGEVITIGGGGPSDGDVRTISDYDGATDTVTVSAAWSGAPPDATSTYTVARTVIRFWVSDSITFTHAYSLGLVVGDQFVFSPVYARVVGANVPLVDRFDEPIPTPNFRQVRLINSVGAAFSDVSGDPTLDATRTQDHHFNGLVFKGTELSPTTRAQSLDDEGVLYAAVEDGETVFYAGFGSDDANVEGRFGIQGTSLSPGIEIICPDLDYRLLGMLVRGKILGTERARIGRST